MTVSGTTLKHIYSLDESTTVFPYTFKIFEDSDMKVTLYTVATGAETVLTLTTDYTVTGAGLDSGTRNVTYAGAASYGSAYQLILQPSVAYTQTTDYEENDDFAEATHETALDRLSVQIRQLKELLDRTFKLDASQSDALEFTPGTGYLYSDGTNYSFNDIEVTELDYEKSFLQGPDASKSATPSVGDQYFATDTNKQYRCATTNIWTLDRNFGDVTLSGSMVVSGATALGSTLNVLGNVTLSGATLGFTAGTTINEFSIDGTLAGNSDDAVPTEKAVKTYADAQQLTSIVLNGTRNISLTADLAITGAGFKPSTAIVFATVNNTAGKAFWGVAGVDKSDGSITDKEAVSAGTYSSAGSLMAIFHAAGDYNFGSVKSWDSDGLTIEWAKTGSPTGTIEYQLLLIK